MSEDRMPMANIPPFGLRMRPELKAQIEEAASANNRSLNAEIVTRLWDSLDAKDVQEFKAKIADMSLALESSEEIRAVQAKYIEALSAENEALKKAGVAGEQIIYQLASAVSKAAAGDRTELDRLVEQERERPILKRLTTVWSIVDED